MGILDLLLSRLRIADDRLFSEADSPIVKKIQFRGVFPVGDEPKEVGFVFSVFAEDSSGALAPVFSMVDAFQEDLTHVYHMKRRVGRVTEGMVVRDWVTIGAVVPMILHPPYGGACDLVVRVRLVDWQDDMKIIAGHVLNEDAVLWQKDISFHHVFTDKGYKEAMRDREEAQAISIKIAVEVAMADGELHEREKDVIRAWANKAVEGYSEDKKKSLKALYRKALQEGYEDATRDVTAGLQSRQQARLSRLLSRLRDIGEKKAMYDMVELVYDIMTADGKIAKEEMALVRFIEKGVDLDTKKLEAIRDIKMIGAGSLDLSGGELSLEDRVGIDPQWGHDKIMAHIKREHAKWNGRLSTLSSPEERAHAQRMLDDLGKARKKYGK
ncbi:MAG: TerB family tellurite resistance protein [Alphaproteobacteria bacterium GM7ARS4]|nr:TerB family tellurite resistance protein [Alphaproteobacteria bacterium GM7ARS4]